MMITNEAAPLSDQKNVLREKMVGRVDLTPSIETVREGSFKPTVTNADLNLRFLAHGESAAHLTAAQEIWDKVKVERNTYSAIFIEEVWSSFAEERENFTFNATESMANDSEEFYQNIRLETYLVFANAINKWKKKRDLELRKPREEWDNLDKAYYRFKRIMRFGRLNAQTQGDSEAIFISKGVGTASGAAWGAARMIEFLAEKQQLALSNQEKLEILERAYGPVISIFAGMNQDIAISLMKKTGLSLDEHIPQNPVFSIVKDTGSKFKLTVDHEALSHIQDDAGQEILGKQPSSETTWCPAGYAQGDKKNVLREYFEWIMELAKKYRFQESVNDLENT